MIKLSKKDVATVKVYHGYGHEGNLIVFGHVLLGKPPARRRYTNNALLNIIHLVKLFFVRPLPGVRVQLHWHNQQFDGITESDGFFKFEWQSASPTPAGWHPVLVQLLDEDARVRATGTGKVFVPHITQYAFISDIDDTVLVSHSATVGRRLRVLFTKNPHSRRAFDDVVTHYHLLSVTHTKPSVPNPFFYVSSSEWNLYDDLNEFFKHNQLPEGAFLLSEIKKWYQLFKTGKTKHHAKLMKVARILEAYPAQRFVLLGDNSQSDPDIYTAIANKYPDRIGAIYIRNIRIDNKLHAETLMAALKNKEIKTCLFEDNHDAIQHSKTIGLIE
ncbi:MAG: App1 family protein [Ferruginibacter sp.]